MSVNFTALRTAIHQAARLAFAEVRAAHPDERFYAFALYTDDGVMTVVPAANSEQALRLKIEQSGETDPAQFGYYRWATAEWAYEAVGGEHFQAASNLLNVPQRDEGDGGHEEKDDAHLFENDSFVAFKNQVIEIMVEALEQLDAEGFFGSVEARGEITLFASISDSDAAEQVETESAKKLNPPVVYKRFAARSA